MIKLNNHHLATINNSNDSGKNYQWVLKLGGKCYIKTRCYEFIKYLLITNGTRTTLQWRNMVDITFIKSLLPVMGQTKIVHHLDMMHWEKNSITFSDIPAKRAYTEYV